MKHHCCILMKDVAFSFSSCVACVIMFESNDSSAFLQMHGETTGQHPSTISSSLLLGIHQLITSTANFTFKVSDQILADSATNLY